MTRMMVGLIGMTDRQTHTDVLPLAILSTLMTRMMVGLTGMTDRQTDTY